MAGDVSARASRQYYDDYDDYPVYEHDRIPRDTDRRHHRRHSHRHRDKEEEDAEYWAAKRERRERRRREAELEFDEPRTRTDPYYMRPSRERDPSERRRESERMARDLRAEREDKLRSSHQEVRRDGTRRKKRRDDEEEYVYTRPRGVVEEVTVQRTRRRSNEEGSSSRTGQSPPSGSRSASLRRAEVPKLSRTISAREPNRVYTRPALRRTSTVKLTPAPPAPVPRAHSVHHQRRSTGILTQLFAPPIPRPVAHIQPKEARVECLVCMNDDLPRNRTAKLGCGHRMCHTCLRRIFSLSVTDPQHMPPRCCRVDHIPLKYVERLFDDKFKRTWNKKYQEYTTQNRLYCPTKGCGEWIKPSKIRMDMTYGRKYARCSRCSTKVCAMCNSKFHVRRECPKDPETKRIVEMAKAKGWQSCYHCKTLVELKEGCNHMTCRCAAQFCMVCAAPWKTCNCPWFTYNNLSDDDRLNDMRIPQPSHQTQNQNTVEVISDSIPPVRRSSTRIRHRSDPRDLDRTDELLAAQLQAQLSLEPSRAPSEMHRNDSGVQVYGLGNAGSHHMNESYAVRPLANSAARAAHISAPPPPPPPPPQPAPAPRAFYTRRLSMPVTHSTIPIPPPPPPPPPAPQMPQQPRVRASTMAGLSRDGTKRGANRVGTWLNHIQFDHEAIHTAPRGVDVDDWRVDGTIVGID